MLMIHILNDHVSIYEASAVVAVAFKAWSEIPKDIWMRLDEDQKSNIQTFFNKDVVLFDNLPSHIQDGIEESLNFEFWDSVFYNPFTCEVRYFDADNNVKLSEPWREVEF